MGVDVDGEKAIETPRSVYIDRHTDTPFHLMLANLYCPGDYLPPPLHLIIGSHTQLLHMGIN